MKNLLWVSIILMTLSTKAIAQKSDVVTSNIDSTMSPATDFFQFANGGWFKRNPIPSTESSWGIGRVLYEDIYAKKRIINENLGKQKLVPGSIEQKIYDFWQTGMDSVAIEKMGITAIKPELDAIANVQGLEDLLPVVANMMKMQIYPLMYCGVQQDEKQSDTYTFHVYQSGLGLGDRDYYFKTDARNVKIRAAYEKHIGNMFALLGSDTAMANAKAHHVVEIETFLATKHRTIEETRDPQANYNKFKVSDLEKKVSQIPFGAFFNLLGVKVDSVIVGQPEYLEQIQRMVGYFALDQIKDYLTWFLVKDLSPTLGSPFDKEHFAFFGKELYGRKEQKPRWKRVSDAQEGEMGDALGKLFVKSFFSEKAKTRYTDMVEAVRTAFGEEIQGLDWMSDTTKARAIDKLKRVTPKVGYPNKWKDFSTMQIDGSSYARNTINANKWWFNYQNSKLGQPVDRTEWDMTPQTYNAYYNPSNNEIVLPAAILMVPNFKDEDIDDAVAYGYVAASTIGHEITHGFDDQGRQFNADGNLIMWWQPTDSVKFTAATKKLINQFDEIVAIDTMHIRGEATQGENIADLGGIVLGLKAFKKTDQFKQNKKIAGYTPLQRYFLGYALGWLDQQTQESLARAIMTDVHAPAKFRVNAPFADVPEFYEAFHIKPTDAMWRAPEKRVKIW